MEERTLHEQYRQFEEYWRQVSKKLYYYLLKSTCENNAQDILADVAMISLEKFPWHQNKHYVDYYRWVFHVANIQVKRWKRDQKAGRWNEPKENINDFTYTLKSDESFDDVIDALVRLC